MDYDRKSREHVSVDEYLDTAHARDKIWKYLQKLSSDESSFLKRVKDLRKKYDLPLKGLSEIRYEEYEDRGLALEPIKELASREAIKDLISFTKELGIPSRWCRTIIYFVAYGRWLNFTSSKMGLVHVEDIKMCLHGPFYFSDAENTLREYVDQLADEYPVAILVNPYASQRDVIDFVKNYYKKYIEPSQKRYRDPKVLLGKIRKKNSRVQRRNGFIYKNRDLPKAEIISRVVEEFGEVMDYTYINKIIADEKKKRK